MSTGMGGGTGSGGSGGGGFVDNPFTHLMGYESVDMVNPRRIGHDTSDKLELSLAEISLNSPTLIKNNMFMVGSDIHTPGLTINSLGEIYMPAGQLSMAGPLYIRDDSNAGYFFSVSATGVMAVAGAAEFDSSVGVDGDLRLGQNGDSNFTVSALGAVVSKSTSTLHGDLQVGDAGTNKFKVLATSGAITSSGTLSVGSTADFASGKFAIAADGSININDGANTPVKSFEVDKDGAILAHSIADKAAVQLWSIGSDGAAEFATLKSNGDADLDGQLDVAQAANFGSTVTAGAKLTVSAGGASIVGDVDLNDKLDVSGKITASDELDVAGKITGSDELDLAGKATLSDELEVAGKATLSDVLEVTGKITGSDELEVAKKLTVSSEGATIVGNSSIRGTFEATGAVTMNSTLDVDALATMKAGAKVEGAALEVADDQVVKFTSGGSVSVAQQDPNDPASAWNMTIDPAPVGNANGRLVILGDLQVDGTTTTINSTQLDVDDKSINIAKMDSPQLSSQDQAGIYINEGDQALERFLRYRATDDYWSVGSQEFRSGSLKSNDAASAKWTIDSSGNAEFLGTLSVTSTSIFSGDMSINNSSVTVNKANAQKFKVDSDGNVDAEGTLELAGKATLADELEVIGATTLDTLDAQASVLASAKVSDLTAGRVVLAGTDGEIEDSANLTFDGSKLDVTGDIEASAGITAAGEISASGGKIASSNARLLLSERDLVINDANGNAGASISPAGVLSLADSIAVNTDKFTVSSDGAVVADSSADIKGDFKINTNMFQVAAASGNTTIQGSLDAGDSTLASLEVTADADIKGGATVDGDLESKGGVQFSSQSNSAKFQSAIPAEFGSSVQAEDNFVVKSGTSEIFGVTYSINQQTSAREYDIVAKAPVSATAGLQVSDGEDFQVGDFKVMGSASSTSHPTAEIIEAARHMDPSADKAFDLGYALLNNDGSMNLDGSEKRWRNVFAEKAYLDELEAPVLSAEKIFLREDTDAALSSRALIEAAMGDGEIRYINGKLYWKDDDRVGVLGEQELTKFAKSIELNSDDEAGEVSLVLSHEDTSLVRDAAIRSEATGGALVLESPSSLKRVQGDAPTSHLKVDGLSLTYPGGMQQYALMALSSGGLVPADAQQHDCLFGQADAAYQAADSYAGHFEMQDREFTAVGIPAALQTSGGIAQLAVGDDMFLGAGAEAGMLVKYDSVKHLPECHIIRVGKVVEVPADGDPMVRIQINFRWIVKTP